jgi:hypothetical protein
MCIAEWSWGSKSKPFICSSLKSASKSRQDEMRYTFDVAKCDRIFDYMLQEKQIKLPSDHVIPLSEQLKKHAYCKWYNSYSHATNDCNIFHQQVQSAINEGRLKFVESQDEARKGPALGEYEYGRARGEEGTGLAISGQDNQGKGGCHRRGTAAEDDQGKKFEGWPMAEERGGQVATPPKGHLRNSSRPSTRKVGPVLGGTKTGPSGIPNRTVQFPGVRPTCLQSGACPASDFGPQSSKIQKVEIIITKIIIRRLTFWSGHQCMGHGDIRR